MSPLVTPEMEESLTSLVEHPDSSQLPGDHQLGSYIQEPKDPLWMANTVMKLKDSCSLEGKL